MFFNVILANTTKGLYLQHMLNVAAKEGTGVKAPIEHEIMNKYLKAEKEELEAYCCDPQPVPTYARHG